MAEMLRGRTKRRGWATRSYQRDLSADREIRRFEVGLPERGQRLDVFLASRLRWASRARIREWIESGRVEVTGPSGARAPRGAQRVADGAVITVSLDAAHLAETAAQAPALVVVHEDDWLLAISKPPRCNVHPTRRHRAGSLVELVHRRERELEHDRQRSAVWMPSPCHRLDRDTSGLVLFARDPQTRAAVGRQIEQRLVRKLYLAWVCGVVRDDAGEIDLPIGPDAGSALRNRRAVRADGQPALTRFRVAQRGRECTLLELEPVTGRTHQLRVHLAAIGHPILGDALYQENGGAGSVHGERAVRSGSLFLERLGGMSDAQATERLGHVRLALHALRLSLEHPARGERLELVAPTWPDLDVLSSAVASSAALSIAPEDRDDVNGRALLSDRVPL